MDDVFAEHFICEGRFTATVPCAPASRCRELLPADYSEGYERHYTKTRCRWWNDCTTCPDDLASNPQKCLTLQKYLR